MQRTKYSNKQKASIALEAIKGQKTLNQILSQYQVHLTQISILDPIIQTTILDTKTI